MSRIAQESDQERGSSAVAEESLTGRLRRYSAESTSLQAYIRACLAAVAEEFRAHGHHWRVQIQDRTIEDQKYSSGETEMRWQRILDAALIDTAGEKRPHARHVQSKDGARGLLLSAPLNEQGPVRGGAIALITTQASVEEDRARMTALLGHIATIEAGFGRFAEERRSQQDAEAVERGISRAATYESPTELAFALTNNLRVRLNCDQVFLGIVRGRRARVLALSGVDDPNIRSSATLQVRQAMEECFDHGAPIVAQREEEWNDDTLSSQHRLHRKWHEDSGYAPVASYPLKAGGQVVAVISLRRPHERALSKDEHQRIEQLVEPLGMGLLLLQRANRPVLSHARESLSAAVNWLFRGQLTSKKLILAGVVLLALIAAFGRMEHEVRAEAVALSETVAHYSAPFTGLLASVSVRAGDRVTSGAELARFDTKDLDLELRRLEQEINVHRSEQAQHVLDGRDAEAEVARQRLRMVGVQLEEVRLRKERSAIRARADGVVLSSELHRRIGEILPQGEPLLQIAPESGLRLELAVPESSIASVSDGFRVRFAPKARPEKDLVATVGSVRPAAEVRDRRNVVLVEAKFADGSLPPWLRPGMEGVAVVEAGSRPIYWLIGHRIVDWFHLEVMP